MPDPRDPLVVIIMRQFKRQLLEQEAAQMQLMARQWLRIEASLAGSMDALALEIEALRAAGESIPISRLIRMDRYKALTAQARKELLGYSDDMANLIAARQAEWGALGIQAANESIRASFSGAGLVVANFDRLPVAAIEAMIGFAGDGSPLNLLLRESWPDAVQGLTNSLVDAIARGINPRETARAMSDGFGVGLDRALTIARTEQLRTFRESNRLAYQESGVVSGYRRMSARDDRVCAGCLFSDGEEYELEVTFEAHPNCRCLTQGTQVLSSTPTAFSTRRFDGEVVTIRTTAGKLLTVTPNHPILTHRGWVFAGLLHEGDYVVSDSRGDWASAGADPDKHNVPTLVEEIPAAFGMSSLGAVPASPQDFHGDGKGSNIYVVYANRLLLDNRNATLAKPSGQQGFGLGYTKAFSLPGQGGFGSVLEREFLAANGIMRNVSPSHVLFMRGLLSKQLIGRGLVSESDVLRHQADTDRIAAHAKGFSQAVLGHARQVSGSNLSTGQSRFSQAGDGTLLESNLVSGGPISKQPAGLEVIREALVGSAKSSSGILGAFASNVCLDRVLEISRSSFSGHVYNLQTQEQWYIANGIVTHNCTCVPNVIGLPAVEWQNGQSWFLDQNPDTQESILGPGGYEAWQDGVELDQFVTRREDDTWGNSLVPTPLKDLE